MKKQNRLLGGIQKVRHSEIAAYNYVREKKVISEEQMLELLSEEALKDWLKPEEDEAWADL